MSLLDSLFDGLARLIGLPDDRRDLAPAPSAIPLPEASSPSEPEPQPESQPQPQPETESEPQPEPQPQPEAELLPEPQPQPEAELQPAAEPPPGLEPEPELASGSSGVAERVAAAARELPKAELVAIVDLERGETLASEGPLAASAASLLDAAARTLLAERRLLALDPEHRSLDQAIVHSDDAVHVFTRFAATPHEVLVVVARDPAQLGLTLAKVGRLVRTP